MYLAGVFVRRVEDITEALWGTKVSHGTISNLNKKAYEHIEQWCTHPLSGRYPYVYVDGVYFKRSWGGEIQNVSVLVAIGVNEDGCREIIGAAEGMKEDKESRCHDAKGHPHTGEQGSSQGKSGSGGGETQRDEAFCSGKEADGGYRGNLYLYGFSYPALDEVQNQQHHRKTPDKSNWCLPRWAECADAAMCQTASCSRHPMGNKALHEYGSSLQQGAGCRA